MQNETHIKGNVAIYEITKWTFLAELLKIIVSK